MGLIPEIQLNLTEGVSFYATRSIKHFVLFHESNRIHVERKLELLKP